MAGLKRKAVKDKSRPTANNKKLRLADELNWRSVSEPLIGELQEDGIGFDLEEIEGVQVEYEVSEETGQKLAKFVVAEGSSADRQEEESEEEWIPVDVQSEDKESSEAKEAISTEKPAKTQSTSKPIGKLEVAPFDDKRLPSFERLPIHNSLKWGLLRSNYTKPTPIQLQTWKTVLAPSRAVLQRDVVGVAETGSGKTLAYGLSLLQHAIQALHTAQKKDKKDSEKSLTGLILCPTRELALQVCRHLTEMVQKSLEETEAPIQAETTEPQSNKKKQKKQKKTPKSDTNFQHAPITVIALTGGVSIFKQKRQLEAPKGGKPDIIVATPGRLWELVQENTAKLAQQLKDMPFLVLDEADRMIEAGHFEELEKLFALTNRGKQDEPVYNNDFEDDRPNPLSNGSTNDALRTYVFSATMSKDLQRNLKLPAHKRRKNQNEQLRGNLGALGDLVDKLDFRDEDPLVVNLLPEGGTTSNLKECQIECMASDKDAILYYFLMRYPGKTLIFLSSIDGIRRLNPILSLLSLGTTIHIHSQMEQKARLRAIERFHASTGTSLLLATDVAARGLDIHDIDHVVHYQIPRSADTYIHRSGRTARAGKQGVSLALVSPEEVHTLKSILISLGKDSKGLTELPIEWSIIEQLKTRIELAKKIDNAQHKETKAKHDEDWIQTTADALELDLDNLSSDDERRNTMHAKQSAKVVRLKAELRDELARPLRIAGISSRYVTSGKASQLVKDLVNGDEHSTIVGVRKTTAITDSSKSGGDLKGKTEKAKQ